MKKIFSSKKVISFFVVVAVILLLIFFNFKGWLGMPRNILYWASSPFLKVFEWTNHRISDGAKTFFTLKDLIRENNRLAAENRSLWQENSTLKEAARENELLRARLELGQVEDYKFVLADIIGYDAQAGQYFLINKGQADGLAAELAVVTENNFLIGKIAETTENYSKVLLMTDSNFFVNVITRDNRVNGVVRGEHGLGINLEMVPIDKEIKIGETILTSGRLGVIPKDLIVGQITEIFSKETDIYKSALVSPAVKFGDLESVFVLVR